MSEERKSTLEKLILAGIGALALSGEKSRNMLDELIKRGEITVEQGKVINEELKHSIDKAFSEINKQEKTVKTEKEPNPAELINNLNKLNKEDLDKLKKKLAEMEETTPEA